MNTKIKLQKLLKSFIKGKKIGFSLGILVFFLINGNLGYAENSIMTRDEIGKSIKEKLTKIDGDIKKNKKVTDNLDLEIELLLRQGKFYTKPLALSSQFFASFYGHNTSRNKNKTYSNFREIEFNDPYYLAVTSYDGVILPNIKGYGIVKRPISYADEITFGANIKPKNIEERNIDIHVDSNYKKVKLNIPEIDSPNEITPPNGQNYTLNIEKPTLPGEVNINIKNNIEPVEKIVIGKNKVKTQKIESTVVPTVSLEVPNSNLYMKTIGEVGTPDLPIINVPIVKVPFKLSAWATPVNLYSYWGENNGILSNLSIKSGTISIVNETVEQPVKTVKQVIIGKNLVADIYPEKKSISKFTEVNYQGSEQYSRTPEQDKIPDAISGSEVGKVDAPTYSKMTKPNIGDHRVKYFDTITNAPYVYIGKDVDIKTSAKNDSSRPAFAFIGYVVKGTVYLGPNDNNPHNSGVPRSALILPTNAPVYGKLEDYINNKDVTQELVNELHDYQKFTKIIGDRENKDSSYNARADVNDMYKNKPEDFLFVNNGSIEASGESYSFFSKLPSENGNYRTSYIVNDKNAKITMSGKESIVFNFNSIKESGRPDYPTHSIIVNKGILNVDGEKSFGVGFAGLIKDEENGFLNVDGGKINVRGINAAGIAYSYEDQTDSKGNDYITANTVLYIKSPINVTGDESVGFISTNNGPGTRDERNVVNVDIGMEAPQAFGEKIINQKVDLATGIYHAQMKINKANREYTDSEISVPETASVINIGNFANESIGIYAKERKIDIIPHVGKGFGFDTSFNSEININGGEKNIALLAKNFYDKRKIDGTYYNNDGEIGFVGNINVRGGKDHRVIVSSGKIDIDGEINIGNENNRLEGIKAFYGFSKPETNVPGHIGGIINVKQGNKIHMYLGDNSIGVISDNGKVAFDGGDYNRENNFNIAPNISLKLSSEDNDDLGLYAGNGGYIRGENLKYEFINPLVAISSDGKNKDNEYSNIVINGSEVTYKGKGYALQSKDGGTIHFQNGLLNIDGAASLTKLDIDSPTQTLFMEGTKINVKSNDISLFYLNNQTTPLNTSNFAETFLRKIGITDQIGDVIKNDDAPLYTFATINGGHIVIDSLVDRNNPEDIFGSRTKVQKSVVDINDTLKAIIDKNRGIVLKDNVIGIGMSSANKANGKNDTQINIGENGKIVAKKNYVANTGAIGAYVNFGTVNNAGVIEVEKGSTATQGIGVFATNGAEVLNRGIVEVGGTRGIGIYSTALREENGTVVENEFRDDSNNPIPGQGTLNITNKGTLNIGKSGIGIYAKNNGKNPNTINTVVNAKDIVVDDSDGLDSIGVLGDNVTIVNKDAIANTDGKIYIGKKGIGIYGMNHTNIASAGTIALSDNSTGIKLDSTSTVNNNEKIKLINNNTNLVKNIIGVFFDSVANLSTSIKVDTSELNYTLSTLYTGGKAGETLTLSSDIDLSGQKNTGISLPKGVNLTYNGTINIESKNTDDKGNIGIVATDSNNVNMMNSIINLKGEGSTGIYAINSDRNNIIASGTTINFQGKDNSGITLDHSEFSTLNHFPAINFSANVGNEIKNNKGIYAINKSTVNVDNTLILNIPENAGIFAHIEDSNINIKDNFTLNGGVGIYSENKGVVTIDSGKKFAVNKGGIGIKSGNENTDTTNTLVLKGDIIVSDNKSIGIYWDKTTNITSEGNIDVNNKGIGIYLNSGELKGQGLKFAIDNATTGIYVGEKGYLGDSDNKVKIAIRNKNSSINGVGIFFENEDVNNTKQLIDNDDLSLNSNNIIGRYYSSSSKRIENGNLVLNGVGYIGNYLENGTEIVAKGTVVTSNDGDKNIAYFIDKGKLKIQKNADVTITDKVTNSNSQSIGIVINGETSRNRAEVENSGVITVIGDAIAAYGKDSNYTLENNGSLIAISDGDAKGTAVYLKGKNNKNDESNKIEFYNSGDIQVDNLGIYLENIGEKDKIVNTAKNGGKTGKLILTGKDSVGIYGKNSYIAFNLGDIEKNNEGKIKALVVASDNSIFAIPNLVLKNNEGIGLLAKGYTEILGSKIQVDSDNSIGMVAYNWEAPTKAIENVKITTKGDNGVGIYIAEDAGKSSDLIMNSTVIQSGENGRGVYISKNGKVTTGIQSDIVVNKGIGYYVAGELKAEKGKITTNDDGIAFFIDEGTLKVGPQYQIDGTGVVVSGKNYSTEITKDMNVYKMGIAAKYDKDSSDIKNLVIGNGVTFTLVKNGAIGIYGSVDATHSLDHHIADVDVNLENNGTITFENGITNGIGIYGKGTNIVNSGEINVSSKGYGIFMTNKNSKRDTFLTNTKEIKLNDDGIGIYLSDIDTSKEMTIGKISSIGNNNRGIYLKDSKTTTKLKDADIEINDNSQGIAISNGKFSLKNSKITLTNSTLDENKKSVGIFTKNGLGDISNTLINSGNNGIGIYATGSNGDIKVDLGDGVNSGIKLGENTKAIIGIVVEDGTVGIKGNLYTNSGVGIDVANDGRLRIDDTSIISVNNQKGLGLEIIDGRIVNSDKLKIKVVSDDAQGIYIKGFLNGGTTSVNLPTVKLLAENTKAYIFEDTKTAMEVPEKIVLNKKDQIGVVTKGTGSEIINLNGLEVSDGAKGVINEGNFNIVNKGELVVKDAENINSPNVGIYSEQGKIKQDLEVNVGKNSYGIYADNTDVSVNGVINVSSLGIGVASNGGILSTGNKLNVGEKGAVGVYIKGTEYSHNGDISVGGDNSIGIQGINTLNMDISAENMTVGPDSVGIYSKIEDSVDVNGQLKYNGNSINVGNKGYGFYLNNLNEKSRKSYNINAQNMDIGDEGVGVFVKNSILKYNGNIHVGKTSIAEDGYTDPSINNNSVGIYNMSSDITYNGHMIVDKPLSVGLYSLGKGSNITVSKDALIEVKNGAFGVAGGARTNSITNYGTIVVSGKARDVDPNAPESAVSYGIAAYSGAVENKGVIKVSDGATGIYINGTGVLINDGGRIEISTGGRKTGGNLTPAVNLTDVYGIEVTAKGNVILGGHFINNGEIYVYSPRTDIRNGIGEENGTVIMDNMLIDIRKGKIVVDAASVEGKAFATPEFSQGNNEKTIKIENIFASKNLGLGTSFSGKVVSQSVSWLAKLINGKETGSVENGDLAQSKDLVMIKVPYEKLIVGNKYKNFGLGLDDLYSVAPVYSGAGEIFDDLDRVTDDEVFDKKIAELRGDIYANTQERIFAVQDAFAKSYKEMLDSYNLTKNVDKYSVINYRGRHIDNTIGVNSYTTNTYGMLYLKDKETYKYGEKYGWSIGVAGTDITFKGDINSGSKEKIGSLIVGSHYETPLNENDHNSRLKLLSRVEGTANIHKSNRRVNLDKIYNLKSNNYTSFNLALKNEIFYDYDYSTNTTFRPNIGLDINFGRVNNIHENGDGIKVGIKKKSYRVAALKTGIDQKTYVPISEISDKRFVVGSHIEVRYNMNRLYDGANKARIEDTNAGYYSLSRPEVKKLSTPIGVDLGYEKANNYGVTLSIEANRFKRKDMNYSVRFNYKF